jgi:hypothetical protein
LVSNEDGSRPPGDERTTVVGFSPRRVAVGGRRRATVVATATAVLVAIAVLKPWATPAPAGTETAGSPGPPSSPTGAATSTSPIDARRLPRRETVERAIEPRDEWGVRVMVAAPQPGDEGRLQELWQPTVPALPGAIPSLSGDVGGLPPFTVADGRLQLVGFTAPPDAVVDAITLVVGRPLGRAVTLEVTSVGHRGGGALSILVRPRDGSPWPPGVYQFRFMLNGERAAVTFATFEANVTPP